MIGVLLMVGCATRPQVKHEEVIIPVDTTESEKLLQASKFYDEGKYMQAFEWNVKLYPLLTAEENKKKTDETLTTLIDQKLTKEELENLLDRYGNEFVAARISERLAKFSRVFSTQKNVVGCILPLTGQYAAFGQRSLKGIQLAMEFFSSTSQKPFELAIYDSKGDAQEASRGVERLLEKYGVIAIVGPLLSQSSYEAARKAQELQVPLMSLSQHPTITEVGDYIFRYAMTVDHQVQAIVDYACEKKGLKKFALIYPQDSYGIDFANLFWDKVESCGGTINGVESYLPGQTDFNVEIKKLVGLHQPKARTEEYAEAEMGLKLQYNKEEIPETMVKLKPQIDFEAVFIPDYAKTAGLIVPTLRYYDVDEPLLLGTQGWNSSDLIKRGEAHVEAAVFVDGFSPNAPGEDVQQFVREFKSTFGESPQLWEAQAYDATSILLALLEKEEIQTRENLHSQLLSLSTIEGATGEATLKDNHDIQKKLFLLTVRQGNIVPLNE